MLCENCDEVEATVHQVLIEDNEVKHYHLCENCAQELKEEQQDVENEDLMAEAFSSLSDSEIQEAESCPRCGLDFEEFKKTGRLGCAKCYGAFEEKIEPLIKRIHGADQHVGLTSQETQLGKVSESRKIQMLRKELDRCVKEEKYEEAAELRDRISELEAEESNVSSN